MSKIDKKLFRTRSRDTGERIMANGSLRDHLDDEQAEQMVNWSLDQIESKVEETIELSDKAVEPVLDTMVERMTAIIKNVDELVGFLPGCDNLVKATAAYEAFAKLVVPREEMSDDLQKIMKSFLNNVENADSKEVFAHCWAVVEEHYTEVEQR